MKDGAMNVFIIKLILKMLVMCFSLRSDMTVFQQLLVGLLTLNPRCFLCYTEKGEERILVQDGVTSAQRGHTKKTASTEIKASHVDQLAWKKGGDRNFVPFIFEITGLANLAECVLYIFRAQLRNNL